VIVPPPPPPLFLPSLVLASGLLGWLHINANSQNSPTTTTEPTSTDKITPP